MSTINLLPENYTANRRRQRTNVMCIALFAIVMFGVVTASIASRNQFENTKAKLSKLNNAYKIAAKSVALLRRLEDENTKCSNKRAELGRLLDKAPKSTLLALLTNARPKGMSLGLVKLKTKMPDPPKKKRSARRSSKSKRKSKKRSKKNARKAKAIVKKLPDPIVTVEITGIAGTDLDVAAFIDNLASSGLMKSVDLNFTQNKLIGENSLREFRIICEIKPDVSDFQPVRVWNLSQANGNKEQLVAIRSLGDKE